MSSFVIEKVQYIKAAGIIAGIAEHYNRGPGSNFFVYDYQVRRNMNANDYYNRFCEFYQMNAISVQEQYGDDCPEVDDNKYLDVFREYIAKGKRCAMRPDEFRKAAFELVRFFSSAEYQTEKEPYFFKMKMILNEIAVQLFEKTDPEPDSRRSWHLLQL